MESKIKSMEEEGAGSESQGGSAKGKFSDLSPKELEELTSKSEDELEVAKSKKDFVKCMEIQVISPDWMTKLARAFLGLIPSPFALLLLEASRNASHSDSLYPKPQNLSSHSQRRGGFCLTPAAVIRSPWGE